MPFIKAKISCPVSPEQESVQVTDMEKVSITIFADPMIGLSYESEPIIDRLQKL